MWQIDSCSHAKFTHLYSQRLSFALKIGPYTLALSRGNKVQQTDVPGTVCITNPSLCIPPSFELAVRTIQVDGWTRVALLDNDLNEALRQYGNISPAGSLLLGWYDPTAMLIGLNNVYMCSPSSEDLDVKLADARQCVLKTLLKEISYDIYLGQVSPEAFHTVLFKVLLTMVQTTVRFRADHQNQVAVVGHEYDF
jgi:hypothetical protein